MIDQPPASRLALGTAQFGMPYGIANQTGLPLTAEICEILRAAGRAGVSMIDTAHAYGDAEAVLGRCLDSGKDFNIVTKLPPLHAEIVTSQNIERQADALRSSLLRLGRERVYGLLAHEANDLLAPGGDRLWVWLQSLREEGKVEKIGVSVYSPEQLRQVLHRCETLDIIQLPFSFYDQRFAQSGLLDLLKEKQVEVHSRSVFLQGLLLMAPEHLPERFASIRQHQAALHAWLRDRGLDPVTGALAICLQDPRIDFVVVGCETVRQFDEIAEAATNRPDLVGVNQFAISDETTINPSKWAMPN